MELRLKQLISLRSRAPHRTGMCPALCTAGGSEEEQQKTIPSTGCLKQETSHPFAVNSKQCSHPLWTFQGREFADLSEAAKLVCSHIWHRDSRSTFPPRFILTCSINPPVLGLP